MTTSLPIPSPLIKHFRLDPGVVYLNHGSFGACPTAIIEAQQRHRDKVEADAMQFYLNDLWPMVDRSRSALGKLINAQAEDIVFVNNATTAVATVLNNLTLEPNDELLVTNLEYPACINNFEHAANRAGAKVVVADIPWVGLDEDAAFDAVMAKVTSKTKLLLISLISSATAVRLPVERIIAKLKDQGVETLLDAAHGPGCVPIDITKWGAAYTTGNGHKWLCSPKGVAFLHVREDLQADFRPLVLSNHAMNIEPARARTKRSAFNHEFDYMGTDDRSGVLTIADSIEYLDSLMPGGIAEIMDHNRNLCLKARDLLCDAFGTTPQIPDSMLGPLAVIEIPAPDLSPRTLREDLFKNHQIEIMIVPSPSTNNPMVRISPYLYNSIEQYQYLADAILSEISQ
ncbi:MAG: aminotransferase class V-fold PLP-dependent enzyme [Phycisphaerales bacterium]|nr:aminotransferase class V-fold PLP-dependent enzyme [Phycisphaerales bacterium]